MKKRYVLGSLVLCYLVAMALGMFVGSAQAEPTKPFTQVTKVSWTPSSENTDGTPYTDPKGFVIYCSKVNGSFSNNSRMILLGPTLTVHLLKNLDCLTEGDNYIAITALTLSDLESEYSTVGYAKKSGSVFFKDSFAGTIPGNPLQGVIE